MHSVTSAVTATANLLEQRGVRHGTAELGLDAEYSGNFTGLAVEAKTDTVYVASMGEGLTEDSLAAGATLYPALHIKGRIGTAHHSLQLGPDGWIIRPLNTMQNPILTGTP